MKRDSLSLLTILVCYYQRRLQKGIFTRIKRKIVKYFIFISSFLCFRDFCVSRNSVSFVISANSRNCKTRKLVPHFRETRKSYRSQFREIFAKRNFVKNPTGTSSATAATCAPATKPRQNVRENLI
jgi:hypothetical protein